MGFFILHMLIMKKTAKIVDATDDNLNLCKENLIQSKVIAVPTETVYGLSCNALDEKAILSVYEIKGRPLFNPLIIHIDCLQNAEKYGNFNSLAQQLANKFWPGPLTMVLSKKKIVPDLVTANLDSVAIRCPNNKILLKLLKRLPFPLAAPSANQFGYVSPTSAEHVKTSIGEKIELILDGQECEIGIESTIVDIRDQKKPKILRPGPISKKTLEKFTKIEFYYENQSTSKKLRSPGMLKSHYSPKTPLEISTSKNLNRIANSGNSSSALIYLKRPKGLLDKLKNVYWFSENGSELEIARKLYQLLRNTDALNYEKIFIEAPDEGDGINTALIDRLSKAAAK